MDFLRNLIKKAERKNSECIIPEDIICFDIETTGLSHNKDEILQLSIINGNGDVLFDEYIRPKYTTSWSSTQKIHGISPEMVADKPTIDEYIPQLNKIFGKARIITGYNIKSFDRHFITSAGITIPDSAKIFDVMLEFAPIYGEKCSTDSRRYKKQRLAVCAKYYGYEGNGRFHDSLEDVRATLHCYYGVVRDRNSLFKNHTR